jgi:hypothetical protein
MLALGSLRLAPFAIGRWSAHHGIVRYVSIILTLVRVTLNGILDWILDLLTNGGT